MITIPDSCKPQPDGGEGIDANGNRTFTYVLMGPYSDLTTLLRSLKSHDEIIEGWVMLLASLARRAGDLGTLSIQCAPKDTSAGEGDTLVQKALEEIWTIRSVRNDMSILGYCGESASNPSREQIEAWMKEPDGTLAAANKYRKPDGTIEEIDDDEDLAVIDKIRKGVESVMRFYPQLTKTRTYSTPPLAVYEHLAEIDTPTLGAETEAEQQKYPGNLQSIIDGCQWLKCQDDCIQSSDGKWQRVESWMGLPNTGAGASAWDPDLYGPSRWPIPLHTGEGGVPTGGGQNGGDDNDSAAV